MAGAQGKFGGAARIGKPRAADLRAIYGRIEAEAVDLGKGGKIARSRSEPVEAKAGQGSGGGRKALSLSVRQRVNAAKRLPPAIVKVIRKGQTGGKRDLRNQLDYLTRKGELNLTRADGEVIDSAEGMADLMQGWKIDFESTSWKHKTTHLLVSSPEGTDPEVMWRAADRFAGAMFEGEQGGERWDYVKIAHDDTEYPHVHFVVNNLGLDSGEQFKVWPTHRINPQLLRTTWAEAARAEGLELDDTPRRARGLPPSREKTPDRQRAEEGEVSTYYLNRAAREIVAASEGRETGRARQFRCAFGEILEAERQAYRETAESLRSGAILMQSDALRRDAEVVDAFADGMTMPPTDGDLVVAHLQHFAKEPKLSGINAFRIAALGMVIGEEGEEWRILSEVEQDEAHPTEDMAEAVRKRFDYMQQLFKLEDDPARRVEFQARLGQERISLAALAERPEWTEPDVAGDADRPVTEARQALLATEQGDAREWIVADADRIVLETFSTLSAEPEEMLARIRYEGPVDRATARQWRAEEVAEVMEAHSVSEAEAVNAIETAHRLAFDAYDRAPERLQEAKRSDVSSDREDARAVPNKQADMQREMNEVRERQVEEARLREEQQRERETQEENERSRKRGRGRRM